jgi:hypothetical protein
LIVPNSSSNSRNIVPDAVPGRWRAITRPATATSQPPGSLVSCALVASIGTVRRGRRIASACSPSVTELVE